MSASIARWISLVLMWLGGFVIGFEFGKSTGHIKQEPKQYENR